MKRYIITAVILAMLSAACTKTVNVKTPQVASKLVINSKTYTGDYIQMQVSKSVDIKNYKINTDLNISNATVKIYVNGTMAGEAKYDVTTYAYVSDVIAEKGKEYSIEVSVPGFETVTAKSMVPEQVDISSIKHVKNIKTNAEGAQLDEISISFTDPSTNGDHYVVSILNTFGPAYTDTTYNYTYTECVYTSDPSVESIYNTSLETNTCLSRDRIFFNDILYNGKQKEIKLNMSGNSIMPFKDEMTGELIYPTIALFHITDEYFKYLKSYQYAQDNEGNPFAEPTNAYSNVKNGYGMFSITSHDEEEIK